MAFDSTAFVIISSVITIFFLGFSISAFPGPIFIIITNYSIHQRIREAFLSLLGLMSGECIYLVITLFGYHVFLLNDKILFNAISLIGGIIILIMALKTFTSRKFNVLKHEINNQKFSVFISSFLITLTNPAVIFLLIAMLNIYNQYYLSISIILFFILFEAGTLAFYSLLIVLFYKIPDSIRVKIIPILHLISLLILILLSTFILFTSIKNILC